MKRFTSIFTAVAVALTLMMSVMPMTVFAAYKLTKNDGSAIPARIDVGESFNIKVDGAKVYFYSDNKEVATVGKKKRLAYCGRSGKREDKWRESVHGKDYCHKNH